MIAESTLREIEKSQDGFYLAEVDLKLRGPGEIYGKMQHGDLNLKIASLADTALIARAQVEAERFVKEGQDLLQYNHLAHAVQSLSAINCFKLICMQEQQLGIALVDLLVFTKK